MMQLVRDDEFVHVTAVVRYARSRLNDIHGIMVSIRIVVMLQIHVLLATVKTIDLPARSLCAFSPSLSFLQFLPAFDNQRMHVC